MAFKMKNSALKAQAAMAGCPRTAAKMKAESSMKMKKSAMEMKSPMEMKKSPMEKELVGNQHRLPEELKAKIEAAPSKMRSRKGAMDTESPMKIKMPDAPRGRGKGGSTSYDKMKPGDLTPEQKKERRAKELRDTYKPNKEVGSGKGLKPFDPSKKEAKGKLGKNRKGEPNSPMTIKGTKNVVKAYQRKLDKAEKKEQKATKKYNQAFETGGHNTGGRGYDRKLKAAERKARKAEKKRSKAGKKVGKILGYQKYA